MNDNCKNCPKLSGNSCIAYIDPDYWWNKGRCPLKPLRGVAGPKRFRNPLKEGKGTPLSQGKKCASKWPASGIKTPKRLQHRKGRATVEKR